MPTSFLIGIIALLILIGFATWRTNQALQSWQPEENILLSPPENIARLVLIIISIGLGFMSRENLHTLGWLPRHPFGDVVLGVGIGILLPLMLYLPSRWVEAHHPHWYSDVVVRSIRPRDRAQWPWVIAALLPVAIMEELLFRSLLLGAFAPHVNIIPFVIGVSVIFGLLHLPQGEWGVTGVILVGLLLGGLFLWRQSLLVVVIAHWLMNVMQLVLDAWSRAGEAPKPPDSQ